MSGRLAASALALRLLAPLGAAAQGSTRPLLKKYIGNPDTDALLKEPSVRPQMICIKDWITQVGSGHRDRMAQPKNVQVIAKP